MNVTYCFSKGCVSCAGFGSTRSLRGWYHGYRRTARIRMNLRLVISNLLLIIVFGIALPWNKGLAFLDPLMLSAYGCLGALFTAWNAASGFQRGASVKKIEIGRVILSALLRGMGLVVILLAMGTATVNFGRSGSFALPLLDVLGEALLLGVTAGVALALLAGWLTLKYSGQVAMQGLRVVLVLGVVAFYRWPERLPESLLTGSAISVACGLIFAGLLFRRLATR